MAYVEATFEVVHEPAAVRLARRQVSAQVETWQLGVDLDLVLLLLTEALTNAIVHGDPPASLRLAHDGDHHLRVSVIDGGFRVMPVNLDPPPESDRGRGMQLIDELSDRWGIDVGEGAKTVWFEVSA